MLNSGGPRLVLHIVKLPSSFAVHTMSFPRATDLIEIQRSLIRARTILRSQYARRTMGAVERELMTREISQTIHDCTPVVISLADQQMLPFVYTNFYCTACCTWQDNAYGFCVRHGPPFSLRRIPHPRHESLVSDNGDSAHDQDVESGADSSASDTHLNMPGMVGFEDVSNANSDSPDASDKTRYESRKSSSTDDCWVTDNEFD